MVVRSTRLLLGLIGALPIMGTACLAPPQTGATPQFLPDTAAAGAPALPAPDPDALRNTANGLFGPLPAVMESAAHPVTDAKVTLGRQLYYDTRLSKNQDLSCNSCHDLAAWGTDSRAGIAGKVSQGHKGQLGGRNTPSTYNAALQIAQLWDGRAKDVEAEAKVPILNPIEMALPTEAAATSVVQSIPGYAPLFAAAFPNMPNALSLEGVTIALGAFQRKLVTKDRFDQYLSGSKTALDETELRGLSLFINAGCSNCHSGAGFGGQMFQKVGNVKPFPTQDLGRFAVTQNPVDKQVFKVPGLRNVEKTAPYFHDGSQPTLEAAVSTMVEYETRSPPLNAADLVALVAFLKTLTGELPVAYIQPPAPLPSGPTTPKPDAT
jgi:cytochrome c peroxidase